MKPTSVVNLYEESPQIGTQHWSKQYLNHWPVMCECFSHTETETTETLKDPANFTETCWLNYSQIVLKTPDP